VNQHSGIKLQRLFFTAGMSFLLLFAGVFPLVAANPVRQMLHGHVPKVVAHLQPIGPLPASQRLNLAIGLPLRNEAALDVFLQQLYDPANPNYHHYLTPEQFTEKFGPTEQDYQKVIAFARANGLTVTATHGNRILLDVIGRVPDIEKALHLTMRVYQHPKEKRTFYSPDAEPSVDLDVPVADISGLDNCELPHPKNVKVNSSNVAANAVPKSGSGSGGTYIGNDFRAAYAPGTALTGSGQMIGLVQFDGFYSDDIVAYENLASLPNVSIQTVLLDGYNGVPTANGGNVEVSLDIEMAISMAPGLSKVVVFEAGPSGIPNDVLNAMAANSQIKQFSCSWGWSGGPSTTTDNIFKTMAAQGQSFFNASGDSDAFTTGSSSANGVDNPSLDNAPSSSPYITEVGGTTLTMNGTGGSYVSETVWNWGGGTGSSGGISSYYSIPSWQTNVNVVAAQGSASFRNTPDVALTADNVYVGYGNGTSETVGGTSCAAPLWAGFMALVNQQAAANGLASEGFINPAIYMIAQGANYTSCFHDVTTGNNTSPNSPSLFSATSGYDLCTGLGTPEGQNLINALATPPDALGIMPATGFASSGQVGGPFNVTSQTFSLTNSGASSLNWSLTGIPSWLNVSLTGGTLSPSGSFAVTVSLNSSSSNLLAGVYTANLTLADLTSGIAKTLQFTLSLSQSLVQNGGFETGDFTGWTLTGTSATSYNSVDNGSPISPHSGTYAAALGELHAFAYLTQTLTTQPGQNYLLSFWLDNPSGKKNSQVEQFLVNWNTNAPATSTIFNQTYAAAFGWTNILLRVAATGTSTVLQFQARNDPYWFGLDDIAVTPIPTPTLQTIAGSGSTFQFTWNALANVAYQVQYKTNLLQTNWINLGTSIKAAASTMTATNAGSTDPRRFYRVIVP
jgi:subtilase family serine protease